MGRQPVELGIDDVGADVRGMPHLENNGRGWYVGRYSAGLSDATHYLAGTSDDLEQAARCPFCRVIGLVCRVIGLAAASKIA